MTEGRTASAAARRPAEVSPVGEDAIDRIEQAWRRERPDIDVSSAGIISRIWRVSRHLERERKERLAELSDADKEHLRRALKRLLARFEGADDAGQGPDLRSV